MGITGIGSVQTYIYHSQTGKLSSKDGSADEFVDYFNGVLTEEDSENLNGYDACKKNNIETIIDLNDTVINHAVGESWFQEGVNEYEITCEMVSGNEFVYSVNGRKVFTCCACPTHLLPPGWEDIKGPYKTHQSKAYDPETNSMNIAVGDVFDLDNGYKLRVWEDCVEAVGYGSGSAADDEKIRHFADQQCSSLAIWPEHTPMLLSLLQELGIDTSREFTLNETKCIVKDGKIQEAGNKWVIPSSAYNKALQQYEEFLSKPLSSRKDSSSKT